jgi:hypothetical protein
VLDGKIVGVILHNSILEEEANEHNPFNFFNLNMEV